MDPLKFLKKAKQEGGCSVQKIHDMKMTMALIEMGVGFANSREDAAMEKIGVGRTAEVFATDDRTAVKLFYDWVSASHVQNEISRAKIISEVYPDAPRFIRAGEWDGRRGLEMEYIQGEMGTAYLMKNLLRVRQILEKMAAVHKEMHRIQAPSLPGPVEKFGPDIADCPYLSEASREQLQRFLQDKDSMDFLCHGDFHPENILIVPGDVTRVIDWLDAYRGDPMADVARTWYLLGSSTSPQPGQSLPERMIRRVRSFLSEQYLRYYYRGEKFLEKDWLTWQLIIFCGRTREGINEELPKLHWMIRRWEQRLFPEVR